MITIDRHTVGGADMAQTVREGLTRAPQGAAAQVLLRRARLGAVRPDHRAARVLPRARRARDPQPARAGDRGGRRVELVELGSGMASKTRALLYAMAGAGTLRRYVPFDVDAPWSSSARRSCTGALPGPDVHGVVGDFERDLTRSPRASTGCSPSSAGRSATSTRPSATASSRALRELMGPTDRLLLGTDLVKDRAVIEAAYNDSDGRDRRVQPQRAARAQPGARRRLRPRGLRARRLLRPTNSWIEMRLRATAPDRTSDGADLDVEFADGEEMRTEISAQVHARGDRGRAGAAGLPCASCSPTTRACSASRWPRPE